MRRRDGSVVELSVAGGAIRSPAGAGLGLWVATGVAMREGPVEGADLLADLPGHLPSIEPEVARPAVGTLDDRWRVASLSADVEELLGHDVSEIIGSSIIDMTHPRDAADLLLAFVCATSHRTAYARVRLRDRHRGWQAVTLMVTLLDEEEGARFAFGIARNEEPQLSAGVKRLAELEDHLRRIAAEVRAAGVLRVRAPDADATRVPALSEMSARQWEVISRLARGEGVATIANEMYLSQSTVRNHLSAIFRKVGVHTQRELLALLRDGS
jgi:DNA-binding CsgD family transcriptional regulator